MPINGDGLNLFLPVLFTMQDFVYVLLYIYVCLCMYICMYLRSATTAGRQAEYVWALLSSPPCMVRNNWENPKAIALVDRVEHAHGPGSPLCSFH